MINFNDKTDVVPSSIILSSIVILALTLIYMLAVPMPTTAGIDRSRAQSRMELKSQIKAAKERTIQTISQVTPKLWSGDTATISASVLSQLNFQLKNGSATIDSFRPQKAVDLLGISELPFNVQVSGSYLAISKLMAYLDRSQSKIVLESAQLSSSDRSASAMSATLGISVYVTPQPITPSTLRTTGGDK